MKKVLILSLCILTAFSLFSVSAFAESTQAAEVQAEENGDIQDTEQSIDGLPGENGNEIGAPEDAPSEDGESVPAPEEPKNDGEDSAEATEKNAFEMIYEEICIHSEKIFSALAFIGSLLLAFAYRKGLLPLIKGALTNMATEIEKLRDSTNISAESANSTLVAAGERLDGVSELFRSLTARLESLEEELKKSEEEKNQAAQMRTVISAQVDMLYEIFMSSSLPVYQKDIVGERISEMKKALGTVKCDEEK